MPVLALIATFIDGLVHPAAHGDRVSVARHRICLMTHLATGLLALIALPIFLAYYGAPSVVDVTIFGLLVVPLAVAWHLSSTGRLETAYLLSALNHLALVLLIASATGGTTSPALAWLLIVPLEATLSGSRRVIAVATTLAVCGAAAVLAVDMVGLRASTNMVFGLAGVMLLLTLVGMTYVAVLAGGFSAMDRDGDRLRRQGDTRYRLLAENATDLITRHAPNGAVMFASPAAEALLGVSPLTLANQGLFARIHVADRPAYLSAMSRAAIDHVPVEADLRVRRDGADRDQSPEKFIWVELRCRPDDDAGTDGTRRGVVAVMRDISERKRQQEALELARQEAERANIAKSRFLATMSHELRTPLNAIIGFAEMLTKERELSFDAARRHDYARVIHQSGEHLLSVVNGILDMSRIESGKFELVAEPFQVESVIQACCEMMALKVSEAGLTLTSRLAPDLPEIEADRRALKQVLLNLLSNAVKFTKPGGTVSVTASLEAGEFMLSVSDTGIGIASDDLPRVGEAFFQAGSAYDRPFEGTGLGLSVVKGLVALHRGRLEIASRLGEGTRVSVFLPRRLEQVSQDAGLREVVTRLPTRPSRAMPQTQDGGTRKRA